MPKKISTEEDWEARYDFETLARAEEIKKDKVRSAKAKKAGEFIIKKQESTLKSLKAVSIKVEKKKGK